MQSVTQHKSVKNKLTNRGTLPWRYHGDQNQQQHHGDNNSAVTKILFQDQDQDPVVQDQVQDKDFSFKIKAFCLTPGNTWSQK